MTYRPLPLMFLLVGLIYIGLAGISLYQYFEMISAFASYGISAATQSRVDVIREMRAFVLVGALEFMIAGLAALVVAMALLRKLRRSDAAAFALLVGLAVLHTSRMFMQYQWRIFCVVEVMWLLMLLTAAVVFSRQVFLFKSLKTDAS